MTTRNITLKVSSDPHIQFFRGDDAMTLWFTWYAEVIIEIEGMLQQRYE